MSTNVLSALPSSPLPSDAVNELADSEEFDQVIAVRGYYTNSGPVTFQLLFNLRRERLIAVHFDKEQDSWVVVYDSDDLENPEDYSEDGGHPLYEEAHYQLEQLAPDNIEKEHGSYFENTLSDKDAGEDMSMIPKGQPEGIVTSEDMDQ